MFQIDLQMRPDEFSLGYIICKVNHNYKCMQCSTTHFYNDIYSYDVTHLKNPNMICVNILPAEVNESVGWCWWCCGAVPAKLPRHTVSFVVLKSGWIL